MIGACAVGKIFVFVVHVFVFVPEVEQEAYKFKMQFFKAVGLESAPEVAVFASPAFVKFIVSVNGYEVAAVK